MDDAETLYLTDGDEWRRWLSENFQRRTEIWLVYPKKPTGKSRIEYNRAVEEALCFGWIDSTVKSLDPDHTIQRCSEPYKRIRVAYIEAARKRPEEFEKRLRNFLEHTRNGKLIKGYGGIEKYY